MKTSYLLLLLLLPHLSLADQTIPVAVPECGARLERRDAETDVLMARSDCPLSLRSLAQLLAEGFQGMFPDNKPAAHSIHLGRLMNYPEWSQALAKAAAQSPAWDTRRGRPRKHIENDNHQVKMLLNGPAYPQILKPVFARYGLTACIADVEKVLVFKAREISSTCRRVRDSLPNALLPVDAQLWLRLQPINVECD